jgi:hypothetical protein
MFINLLKFMLYLLLLSNLLGCQITQPIYGIPVPDLQKLTEAQKKALSEDFYLIPKKFSLLGYPYPGLWHDDRDYNNRYWNTDRAWQQNEYARQHAIEEQHRAWEASEVREREQRQTTPSPPPASPAPPSPSPASPPPPSTSTQCSADTPCKEFKLR